jgi:hypothetical protein
MVHACQVNGFRLGFQIVGLCAVLLAGPAAARDCEALMSRVPVGALHAPYTPYRAAMLRVGGPAVAPAAAVRRAASVSRRKPARHAVRHKRPNGHRAATRRARGVPVSAHHAAIVAPAAAPLATPRSLAAAAPAPGPLAIVYALIPVTVCSAGPSGLAGLPVLPGGPPRTPVGPLVPPTLAPPPGPPTLGPPGGPPPPYVPQTPEGPYGPPPPPLLPPTAPPITPPTTSVPEPGAWVLLIAGFGLMGARLRARPRLRA